MFRTRAPLIKILVFVASFVLTDWAIEWSALRPKALNAAVDSISLATGVAPQWIENAVVGAATLLFLQIFLAVTNSLRFLAGERRRESRSAGYPHDDGSDDS
jgi:hypothetical protein